MRRAFTLIELLVVVSIIALLIAILLPVLSSAKYAANITKCQITLRSVAAVQLSYAIDNKDFFPAGGPRYDGPRDYGQMLASGTQRTSWKLKDVTGTGSYDLRPIYYDYMQNDSQEAVLHCPLKTAKFFEPKGFENVIISYMVYSTNNHMSKLFNFEDKGGYERLGDTWSPVNKPDVKFTLLASDFTLGLVQPWGAPAGTEGPASSHPAPSGVIYEHYDQSNGYGGYILDDTQTTPNNFADADGSVQTYRLNSASIDDTDTWVVNDEGQNRNMMMPRDLAR